MSTSGLHRHTWKHALKKEQKRSQIMKSSHPLNSSLLILHPHILVSSRSSHILYFLFLCIFTVLKKLAKWFFYLFLIREDITFSFFLLSCCKFIKRESYWISPKLSPLKKLKATTLRWAEGTVGKHTCPTCEDLSSYSQHPYKKWHGMCTRNPALVGGEKSILEACWSAVLNQNSEFCRFSEIPCLIV